jgi:hypothetical protein
MGLSDSKIDPISSEKGQSAQYKDAGRKHMPLFNPAPVRAMGSKCGGEAGLTIAAPGPDGAHDLSDQLPDTCFAETAIQITRLGQLNFDVGNPQWLPAPPAKATGG